MVLRRAIIAALIVSTAAPVSGAKPARRPARPLPVLVTPTPLSPAALYVPTSGCPSAPAGKFATPTPIDRKQRGKSPIAASPLIAAVPIDGLCTRRQQLDAGIGPVQGGALGLSTQVLNTQAGRLDLLAIPGLETQLQKILLRLSNVWPYARPPRLPRVLFRATDSYDAYSLADGTIVLSLGLIEVAESDSELLFVLAHEYGHVLMGHHAASNDASGTKSVIGALGAAYTAGSFISQLRANSAGLSLANGARVANAAKRAAVLSEALRFASDDVWAPAYSRNQEYEADAIAIDLMIGSNQTIDSYTNVFARLQKLFERRAASRAKSEAKAGALQKALGAAMKEMASTQFLTSVGMGNGQGLRQMGGNLLVGLGSGAVAGNKAAGGGDTHPPPEERRAALAGYFQAGYPTADPPIDTGALIGQIKSLAEYRRAIELRNAYLKSRDAYVAQDFDGAMSGLRALGAGTRTTPTFVNFMAGLAAREKGDTALAASYFEAGRSGSGIASAQLHESYTQLEISSADYVAARSLISDADQRFRDPDHFRSLEIARLLASGDEPDARTNYTACLAIKGRDYIHQRCKAAFPNADAGKPSLLNTKLPKLPGLPF